MIRLDSLELYRNPESAMKDPKLQVPSVLSTSFFTISEFAWIDDQIVRLF